ncbi:MAG: pilus assembly protein [Victivallaceae bacterium]|nr:pilus assembly protein [Victivallaceae bacterium]
MANRSQNSGERGSSIMEGMFALVLLCLIFFGMLQIFFYAMAQMHSTYASYFAARTAALGYCSTLVHRAGRVAFWGSSGKDMSGSPIPSGAGRATLEQYAGEYVAYGMNGPRAIDSEYWQKRDSDAPVFTVRMNLTNDFTTGYTELSGMSLLTDGTERLLGIHSSSPRYGTGMFNFAKLILEQ